MYPTLISIGSFQLSSYGVFLALSFLVLTFLVWRNGRDRGLPEEKVFDNVLVVVAGALLGARLFFVTTHWDLFAAQILRIFLLWRFPGFSLLGAILVALPIWYLYTHKQRLPRSTLFDCYGAALPATLFLIALGVFFDGSVTGIETNWITGLPAVAVPGRRHPVALYAAVVALIFSILANFISSSPKRHNLPKGLLGYVSLATLSLTNFLLAFFRADLIYWDGFSLSHIIWGLFFIATLVPIFLLIDGAKQIRKLAHDIRIKAKT